MTTGKFTFTATTIVLVSSLFMSQAPTFAKDVESCRGEVEAAIAREQRAGNSDTNAYSAGQAALESCMSSTPSEPRGTVRTWAGDHAPQLLVFGLIIGALWFMGVPRIVRLWLLKTRLEKMTPAQRDDFFKSTSVVEANTPQQKMISALSEKEKELLIAGYKSGTSLSILSRDFGVTERAIVAWLVRNGYYKRPLGDYKPMEMDRHLASVRNFSASNKLMGIDYSSGIAIDESRKKICLLDNHGPDVKSRVVEYKDLLSVEFTKDGQSATKVERSGKLGSAIVGGLLFGGVGAIVGAVVGGRETSTTTSSVNRVDLRLKLVDTKRPLHDIVLLGAGSNEGADAIQNAFHAVELWGGILEAAMKISASSDVPVSVNASSPTKPTARKKKTTAQSETLAADEIRKSGDLLQKGLITSVEFQELKSRVIGSNVHLHGDSRQKPEQDRVISSFLKTGETQANLMSRQEKQSSKVIEEDESAEEELELVVELGPFLSTEEDSIIIAMTKAGQSVNDISKVLGKDTAIVRSVLLKLVRAGIIDRIPPM